MASDQLVEARDVLEAVRLRRRHGRRRIMQQLEAIEPDLAEHVLEELSRLHRELAKSGASAREVQRLYRQSETLVLVGLLALRQGLVRLWRETFTGSQLAQLDPTLDPPAPNGSEEQASDNPPDITGNTD